MGKILVIEGTDCSGKETQTKMLMERLIKEGYKISALDFPKYESPTGRIVGGPYLGKPEICEGWFKEGANEVDAKVASLYYAADRRYHLPRIKEMLQNNDLLILDRYTFSNMAHQGGKILDDEQRKNMYKFLEELEFGLLNLPRPDKVIFLYMPYEASTKLKGNRKNLDQHETSKENQLHAIKTYLELVKIYGFDKIECTEGEKIKTIEEIHEEVYSLAKKMI